ncbi:MAG: hypothetical protein K6C30_04230 [Bacteroidaceae bacterium]|nr:hypothetical protein [Bacteroidaceae bacterium]
MIHIIFSPLKFILLIVLLAQPFALRAENIDILWPVSDKDNLTAVTLPSGAEAYLTPGVTLGANLAATANMTGSNADSGYEAVAYDPNFVQLTPSTRTTGKTAGHCIAFTIKAATSHTFKPLTIDFDAAKCGTDGGNFDVYIKNGSAAETAVATAVAPLRNKVTEGNANGYSHHSYTLSDVLVQSEQTFQLLIYIYNLNGQDNENPKSIALRNVTISGAADEPIYDASHYFTAASCSAGDLLEVIKNLKNGESTSWAEKLYAEPTDLSVTAAEGYTATIEYSNKYITLTALQDGKEVFSVSVRFVVRIIPPKPEAKSLNRGLLAVKISSGVLVSWRYRKADKANSTRFRLYRDGNLIGTNPITERTNYVDASGRVTSLYRLEVLNAAGEVVESQETTTWQNQTQYITLEGGAPTDPTSAGATYTPNDASYCDMDGDGEYEFILKWAPSNEKDAASSGTTSPAFYACYKMNGTRLWILHTGPNMFNSAHTTPFIAWDLDGDGYGEFMVKTAPGAIDGQGNYVLLEGDDPTANLKSGRGKQDHGPEYITVFDGMTGAELQTIPYHTAYQDETTSFWGDSNQNRSERYLAAIAWLDGEDKNPSAIFARGYYSGCKIGAYDWDGTELTLRWLHRGPSATSGTVTYANGSKKTLSTSVYGEGAHWISVGDVTGDGRQEIHYGSGALKPDGTTLYRTGFGHGDAIHLSDFIPSRPGQEYFMVHEHKPYGADLRDAATGKVLWRTTADDDTGRGIIGHFNPEADVAYWQSSANMSTIFDTDQNVVASNISHGGGASLNNRLYWNGDLADEFYDKSVIEFWNGSGLGRIQVNGGNYTLGTLNNYTKYNPCVLGDLLGDWREEIVTWTQSGSDYQLIVHATNYKTDYCLPHLMDDYAYRAQVINQNCAYNQPPHLSFDPIDTYTIQRQVPASGWDLLYTPYPVSLPEGVIAYQVRGVNSEADTVRYVRLANKITIPAESAILYRAEPGQTVRFRPSTKNPSSVSKIYLKGCSVDTVLTCNEENFEAFYTLVTDETTGDVTFNKVEAGTTVKGGTPWLYVKGSEANPPLPLYFLSKGGTDTAVDKLDASTPTTSGTIFDLDGRVVAPEKMQSGKVYILHGEKVIY